jgi:hypothetical protein
MTNYLFLIAWIHGSETAPEDTHVHDQDDLLPEYLKGNEEVFALLITAPNEEVAACIGYKEAFFQNYTAYDSLSFLEETGPKIQARADTKRIFANVNPPKLD